MLRPARPPRVLALLLVASLAGPRPALAAPVADDVPAFEEGFAAGQASFDRGAYLEAARTWIAAADKLRETTSNRDNRAAVYELAVDALSRGLTAEATTAELREAAGALDGYCEGFTRAYGTETPISAKVVAARDDLKKRLAEAEARDAAAKPDPRPDPPPVKDPPKPAGKPWKGLAIGGGVLLGVGLAGVAIGVAGGARGQASERDFEGMSCTSKMLTPTCAVLYNDGNAANRLGIAGAVAGGVFVAAGAALLAIGLTRKRSAARAWTPTSGPGQVGFGVRASF